MCTVGRVGRTEALYKVACVPDLYYSFTENMIKGLDVDEVEFLDLVDRSKLEEERRKSAEEAREIKDFRDAVATLQERSLEQRIHTEIRSRPPTLSGTSR